MPQIAADKETSWRVDIDEYGIVNLHKIVTLTDDEGMKTERTWDRAIKPDDPIDNLPADLGIGGQAASRLHAIIEAARYPEAVAKYEAKKAAGGFP